VRSSAPLFEVYALSSLSAIKRTLGHQLTSIRRDLQKLELMIKVIVYNITEEFAVLE
jgi:transposase